LYIKHRNKVEESRCVKSPLTRKKCFSVTYVTLVGIWTASSPPSPPSLLGYGNVPCVPLLPPHPRVHCDTSASPLPSLTLTLTKHHLRQKKKIHLLPAQNSTLKKIKPFSPPPVMNSGPTPTCTPITRGRGQARGKQRLGQFLRSDTETDLQKAGTLCQKVTFRGYSVCSK